MRAKVNAHSTAAPGSTGCCGTVIDVGASDAITVPAGGAVITGEAISRRRCVMTCHLHMIEAWTLSEIVNASVGVIARRAVSAVSFIASTAVQAWPIMIAFGILVAVVQLVSFAVHDHGAGATSRSVSSAACAFI